MYREWSQATWRNVHPHHPPNQLSQKTISPRRAAVAEASSLNNMDRKCWTVQKKPFWSHSTRYDHRLEKEKSLEEGHFMFNGCYLDYAWLTAKGCDRICTSGFWWRTFPFTVPVVGALETPPPFSMVTTGGIYRSHSYFNMQTWISLRTEDVSSAFTVPLRIYSKLFLSILYNWSLKPS